MVSAEKIIKPRNKVLLENSPLITTQNLAEICVNLETWDSLVEDGVLSLDIAELEM